MAEQREIFVTLEGKPVGVQIRRQTTERSHHTGRELAELHGWIITAEPGQHEWLSRCLGELAGKVVRMSLADGEFAGKWQVSWNSYGESAGVHTYTLILREAEDLSLESLVLDGRELYPYEYREEVVGDGNLLITAKLVGREEDVLELRELMRGTPTFQVVRRGIHDTPRVMRLGIAEWSEYEDGIKYRLVLLDHHAGETMRTQIVRIEQRNNQAALGFYANFVDRLAELLVARGLVSADDVAQVRDSARRELGVAQHEFWRVPDIDALP